MQQSRTAALVEKVSETSAGFAINFTVLNWLLNPFFDMNLYATESLASTMVFTVLSFGRGYVFRRIFSNYAERIEYFSEQLRNIFSNEKTQDAGNKEQDSIFDAPSSTPAIGEFVDLTITPTQNGLYSVINHLNQYVTCNALFLDDGDFCCFVPVGGSEKAMNGTQVLAYARMPDIEEVLNRIY